MSALPVLSKLDKENHHQQQFNAALGEPALNGFSFQYHGEGVPHLSRPWAFSLLLHPILSSAALPSRRSLIIIAHP